MCMESRMQPRQETARTTDCVTRTTDDRFWVVVALLCATAQTNVPNKCLNNTAVAPQCHVVERKMPLICWGILTRTVWRLDTHCYKTEAHT